METLRAIQQGFRGAPFMAQLGVQLEDLGQGWCEASLELLPWHLQQTGVAHAGVVAALADHCAGAAASTGLEPGQYLVTAEFKINLLRGAGGQRLFCRGEVLRRGRTLCVAEAEVFAEAGGERTLVAKLTSTLSVIAGGVTPPG